jgi:hypothetical protein
LVWRGFALSCPRLPELDRLLDRLLDDRLLDDRAWLPPPDGRAWLAPEEERSPLDRGELWRLAPAEERDSLLPEGRHVEPLRSARGRLSFREGARLALPASVR